MSPWKAKDAKSHTHKARTPKQQQKWAKIANAVLNDTGDDELAIRVANLRIKEGK